MRVREIRRHCIIYNENEKNTRMVNFDGTLVWFMFVRPFNKPYFIYPSGYMKFTDKVSYKIRNVLE